MDSNKDAIRVNNLTREYNDTTVLAGVNLIIREGEFYALMGPNGSGKTTLTSIIACVRRPSSGNVEIYGKSPDKAKDIIAYIPQDNFSSPYLTGRENLTYFAGLLGYSKKEARKIVTEILERIELIKDADKRVSTYSGGMRKRLEIGTALFPSTRILILDEPTTGVDPTGRREFLGMLNEMCKGDLTVLMTTHIGTDAEMATRVGLMDKGRIIAEGQPEELKSKIGLLSIVSVKTAIKTRKSQMHSRNLTVVNCHLKRIVDTESILKMRQRQHPIL